MREKYARLTLPNGRWWARAGKFFLPWGFRLEADGAFVRQVSGINYNTPDNGWEAGYERGPWTAQLAVTRGTAGGREVDSGKQYSLRVARVRPTWRVGGSFNFNDAKVGDRQMQNVFAGLRTGPLAWLAEIDFIRDDIPGGARRDALAAYLEANWLFRKGHNLKFAYDYFDPDRDVAEDHGVRWSLLWEYSPMQFLQLRLGARVYDAPPQDDFANRDEFFAELHGFF